MFCQGIYASEFHPRMDLTTPFPKQWIEQIKTMVEDVVDDKIQPLFTTLQTSIDELATQTASIKKLIKTQKVFNEGIQLKQDDYYRRIMQNTTVRKVIYMMKYVVSSRDGVFVSWPFKLKDDKYIFVTSVNLLKFVARHLFPKDVSQAEIDNIVSELIKCQIETYTFEEKEINAVRDVFPVEPVKKNKVEDKKYKWFGIRAEVLKNLFVALQDQGDVMPSSKIAPKLKEWTQQGRDLGEIETEFKPWGLTPGSRSQVYPTKSKCMIQGKVQWGVEMPSEFFTEDVYKAVQIVGTQKQLGSNQHIGCGWSVLFNQPLKSEEYDQFHCAVKPPAKQSKGTKRKRKDEESNEVILDNPDQENLLLSDPQGMNNANIIKPSQSPLFDVSLLDNVLDPNPQNPQPMINESEMCN
jgi:hypothetical protein